VTQQRHVLDAVRAGDHARHQRGHLHVGVDAAGLAQRQRAGDQTGQVCSPGQRHHRGQPRARHEIRLIEHRVNPARSMRELHPADALREW
jgi:hypothetical protein